MYTKVLGKILTVVVAFVLFVATFLIESRFQTSAQMVDSAVVFFQFSSGSSVLFRHEGREQTFSKGGKFEMLPGDSLDTMTNQDTEISFGHDGVLRLASQTSLQFVAVDPVTKRTLFQLFKGRIWGNTLMAHDSVDILSGHVLSTPQFSVFDLQFDEEKSRILSLQHNVNVHLISPKLHADAVKVSNLSRDSFINGFLLTQGNESTVFEDAIEKNAETLQKLYYSKLMKEVQYGLIAAGEIKSNPWIDANLQEDKIFFQGKTADRLRLIQNRGLKVAGLDSFGYQFAQSVDRAAHLLTFSSNKSIQLSIESIFDHLLDSEYFLIFGRSTEAKQRLDYFLELSRQSLAQEDEYFHQLYLARLRTEYSKLAFVTSRDPLYLAKNEVRDFLVSQLGSGDDDIREKFNLINESFHDVFDVVDDNPAMARASLEEYYQKFTKILPETQSHPALAADALVFANEVFDNLLRQYPVFYKDTYFVIKNRLEQERLKLLPEGDMRNEEKQRIISNKIDFLRQLKSFFLADKVALEDVRQIVFRLFREADDLQLPSDIQLAIGELFAKRLDDFGVFYRYLNSPEYVSTTLHGSTRKEQFSQYLQAQREQVSINEVRQEILGNQNTGTSNPNEVSLPDAIATPPPLTKQEIVARVLLLQKLKSNNIVVTQDHVKILDLSSNQFEVIEATFISHPDLKVSFQYDRKANVVSRIRILENNAEQSVNGEFQLEDLATQIVAQPLKVKRK